MPQKKWTSINTIITGTYDNKTVNLRGWIYRTRSSGNIVFITLRDVTGTIQATVKSNKISKESFEQAQKALIESSLTITGTVHKDERAPGGYEIQVSDLTIIQFAEPFPITKDQSPEFLLDQRHLWIRSQKLTAILKIRSTVIGAIHDFFRHHGFYEFDAPVLQPNQCEGGATLFEVNYYENKTYLSQSWQLYAEAGIYALERIYNMGPTFRAERSKTSRHLSEFWMAEMEAAWMDLYDIINIAKNEIKYILQDVLQKNHSELIVLNQNIQQLEKISESDFPTITYTEALDILKNKSDHTIEWGKDLRTIEENKLMEYYNTPLVVTHYPVDIMAFYKPRDPKNPQTALCFDMLAPGPYGEIIGGSERSLDIKDMTQRLKSMGETIDNYQWYFDLRRYGSVPHAGYGLGVERLLAWICGTDNIKDTIAFPRTLVRYKP